jgi:hypothetical protein
MEVVSPSQITSPALRQLENPRLMARAQFHQAQETVFLTGIRAQIHSPSSPLAALVRKRR